ncbi:MAG: BMP family ABC transporter substrate-binding protein, partial [Actinomycetota bacterium]|nr:BMP family ABC transporter substrate-binding protein [Actinomycetota bacterium]
MTSTWRRLFALLMALGFIAAACGDSDIEDTAGAASETTAAAEDDGDDCDPSEFKIGLVTDTGKVDDKSFNQSAWEGAEAAAADLCAEASFIETEEAKDYEANIQLFVDDGANVIVTVGFGLGEATTAAAIENPDIAFIGVDQFQGEAVDNLAGLIFPEDKSGFLAGALAGMLTQSNVVGAVLGTDLVPPVVAFKEGWENGARYTNADVETI